MSTFYQSAIAEAVVLGLLCGLVGSVVVLRKRSFFTVALTHSTFPGGILAVLLGVNVILGAGLFAVLLVLAMAGISRVRRQGSQVASGVILTGGFAFGMLLQSLNPSLPIQVDSFLVGSILTVSRSDVTTTGIVLVAAIIALLLGGKELLFSSFDPWGYRASGFREHMTDIIALGFIAATVAVAMPAVGSILAIALIVGPAAAARLLVRSVAWMVPLACVFAVASGLIGLEVSRLWAVAAGGAISLTAGAIFVVAVGVDWSRRRFVSRARMAV